MIYDICRKFKVFCFYGFEKKQLYLKKSKVGAIELEAAVPIYVTLVNRSSFAIESTAQAKVNELGKNYKWQK